jgi:DnaK suppressor protein
MAKQSSRKQKASKKKTKVARAAPRKAAAAKRKGKAKTVAKKTKKKVVSKAKAKAAPRNNVAAKKKAKSTTKGSERKTRGAKTAKRKPAARHPPLDLRRFRRQLRERRSELVQAYISTKVDSRSREIDGTEDYIDYAVSSYDREFLLSLTELEQNQLTLVEAALKRLDAREFGLCTQCECPIPTKRLEVQPWARYCLRCQELAEQGLIGDDGSEDDEDDEVDKQSDVDSDFEGDEAHDDDRLAGGG